MKMYGKCENTLNEKTTLFFKFCYQYCRIEGHDIKTSVQ